MKRILGLTSISIENEMNASAERIAQLYRTLPDRFGVHIYSLAGVKEGSKKIGLPRAPNDNIELEQVPSPAQTFFFRLERLGLLPFLQVHRFHRHFPFGAGRHLRGGFDLVQFDSLFLTPWASRIPEHVPVVYSSQNFETEWYQGDLRRYPFKSFHVGSLRSLEKRAVLRADRVIAVTEEDRESFRRHFGVDAEKIVVIPNGYDDTRLSPVSREERMEARRELGLPEGGRIALFVGSNVAPNQDAAESILNVIAPKAPPDLTFVIAGGVGDAFEGTGKGKGRCIITGRVPEIIPYFRAADIGLNPIRLGSGSNIKLLQYLGAGLPVVTTDFGMRGFEDLKPFVAIKRIDLFYRALGDLTLEAEAVDHVRENYGWRTSSGKLARLYDELLGQNGDRSSTETAARS